MQVQWSKTKQATGIILWALGALQVGVLAKPLAIHSYATQSGGQTDRQTGAVKCLSGQSAFHTSLLTGAQSPESMGKWTSCPLTSTSVSPYNHKNKNTPSIPPNGDSRFQILSIPKSVLWTAGMWGDWDNGALSNNTVVTAGMTSDSGMGRSVSPLFSSLLPWVPASEHLLPP